MSHILLTTKLFIPPVQPKIVQRSHLIDKLNQGLGGKLTFVSAPAGFGKSSLLVAWAQGQPNSAAWLSLDVADNDPIRFFTYLLAAYGQINPDIGETAKRYLQSPHTLEPLISSLINDLAAWDDRSILILDDYHLIDNEAIHRAIQSMLEHLPPQAHLMVASRTSPPFSVSRLRVQRQINELSAQDLSFKRNEIQQLFLSTFEQALPEEGLALLEAQTEGWVASLQLVGLSLQKQENVMAFIQDFGGHHHYIIDYLADEILRQQSLEMLSFLLETSILGRLSAPLCDAVTQRNHSQQILADLQAANLFLIPLDERRKWFRYHHLFGDFLRHRLQETYPLDNLAHLHRRAAEWLTRHNHIEEAIPHAFAASDLSLAAQLIERIAPQLSTNGELTTLLDWLIQLPDDTIHKRPRLCLEYGWTLFITGQHAQAEPYLQAAEDTLALSGPGIPAGEYDELKGILAANRAAIASIGGDLANVMTLAQQALRYLPVDNLKWRAHAATSLGLAWRIMGDPHDAIHALREGYSLSEQIGDVQSMLLVLGYLGNSYYLAGELEQAKQTYQQGMDLAEQFSGHLAAMGGLSYIGMGDVLIEQHNFATADSYINKGIHLSEQWQPDGIADVWIQGHISLMRLFLATNDPEAVQAAYDNALRRKSDMRSREALALLDDIQIKHWMAIGQTEAANRWLETYRHSRLQGYPADIHQLTYARVWLAKNENLRDILPLLKPLTQQTGRRTIQPESLLLTAQMYHALGEAELAQATLMAALEIGQQAGFVWRFNAEGTVIHYLLQQFVKQQQQARWGIPTISADYLAQLLCIEDSVDGYLDTAFNLSPLTQRELEILRLAATGMSNREIAEQLILALGTVKRHMSNIYQRLEVSNRTEAVTRAQAMNLL